MGTVKREFRVMSAGQLRAQPKEDNKPPVIEGYAAVFDQASEDLGWFRETIKPGAFSRSLKDGADVRCLMNHNEDNVLGRTKSGTLDVSEDQKGLKFRCELPDTQTARDLHQLVTRGDVDQCSFGFVVRTQNWLETKNAEGGVDVMRELTDVDLFDIGPVTFPAYPQTSVNARALWPDGMPVEVRAHRTKRNYKCQCDCPECEDGDCAECSNEECDDPNCEGERCRSRTHRTDEKKTKRVDGEDLTSDCFLIVGDENDTSTWKLPWKFSTDAKTKSHLQNALARFNQLKDASQEDKDKAWRKLVELCKQYDIDVSEENKSLRRLTANQLCELRRAAEEGAEAADCMEACQQAAHQIKINVEEIVQAIARATEDPAAAVSACQNEFEEIADAIQKCKEFSGDKPDESESERARALVRAIQATL